MKTLGKMTINVMLMVLLAAMPISFTGCQENLTAAAYNNAENLPDISGYPVVSTMQTTSFDNLSIIGMPAQGTDFYGQNSNYPGKITHYVSNGDGTVTDLVSGLMWQSSFDHNGDGSINYADKLSYDEILRVPERTGTGGYTDWRLPTIKEMYSLILFSGRDISGYEGSTTDNLIPFMDTDFFEFGYGDTDNGERLIDMQCATANEYVSLETERMVFGVNFADGRIKAYGIRMMGQDKSFNYLLVRGNPSYGINAFTDNGDGTITDHATGLMWMKEDNAEGILWKDALNHAEQMEFAGYSNWRLPDVKELQSIVDYSRSPATSGTAAIDPLFSCTIITNEAGEQDFPWYWSSTTHGTWVEGHEGAWGAYVSFGRSMGNMTGLPGDAGNMSPLGSPRLNSSSVSNWIDVHGAGAQRSDPKAGDPSQYSQGHGPQGDAIRIYNYVRLVRDAD